MHGGLLGKGLPASASVQPLPRSDGIRVTTNLIRIANSALCSKILYPIESLPKLKIRAPALVSASTCVALRAADTFRITFMKTSEIRTTVALDSSALDLTRDQCVVCDKSDAVALDHMLFTCFASCYAPILFRVIRSYLSSRSAPNCASSNRHESPANRSSASCSKLISSSKSSETARARAST